MMIAIAIAAVTAGCGSRARLTWLPDANQLDRWPYGAAVAIRRDEADLVTGELIAIDSVRVYVLAESGLATVARADVRSIEARADWDGVSEARMSTRSRTPRKIEESWKRLEKYARYPGGLPDSLDRTALRLPPDRGRKRGTGTFLNP